MRWAAGGPHLPLSPSPPLANALCLTHQRGSCYQAQDHMALPTVMGPCLPTCPLRPACSRPGSFPPELWPVEAESLVGVGSMSVCCVRHPQKLGGTRGFVLCLHLVFYFWIWSHQVWQAMRKVEVRAELGYTGMMPRPHRQRCQDVHIAVCRGSGSRCTGDLGAGNPSRVSS